MDKISKTSRRLFVICFISYAIVSMTRSGYSASIAAIVEEGLFTKSQAGVINAGFYFLYGIAQLIFAKLIDKISPVALVSLAIVGTALTSVGMAVSGGFLSMLIIWSISGLVQFAVWPAVIRILAEYLIPEQRKKAMVYIAFSYCIGMLFNYGSAAVILAVSNWKMLFIMNAAILVVTFFVWQSMAGKTAKVLAEYSRGNVSAETKEEEKVQESVQKPQTGLWKLMISSGLLILLIPSFIRTALDLGVKSWVPTMIMESYGVSASFATALTIIMLVVNLAGVFIANYIYPKRIKNIIMTFAVCFALSVPAVVLLLLNGKVAVGWIVLMLIIFTTMMYAGHQVINVIVPAYFAKYNRSGSVAGILNSVGSFGAVAANFGFGYLADHFGWSGTIVSWIIMMVIALASCLVVVPVWKRFSEN